MLPAWTLMGWMVVFFLLGQDMDFHLPCGALGHQVRFEATGAANPAFRVVHEPEQDPAIGAGAVALARDGPQVGNLLRSHSATGLERDDDNAFRWYQEVPLLDGTHRVGSPLLRQHVLKIHVQQRP